MSEQDHNLKKLLALALDRSVKGREKLARTIGALFSEEEKTLSEQERALMTDILGKLISDIEIIVRKALSERLAKATTVPRELVIMLANDEIEVARPILLESTLLEDPDLIDIIKHRTYQHQLAIAMRKELTMEVTDALVDTGRKDLIKTLLDNKASKVSEQTLAYLVDQSRRIDEFQEPLVFREDLPAELAQRMYWWVSAALRSHILKNFPIDVQKLDNQIQDTVYQLAEEDSQRPPQQRPSKALAKTLRKTNHLTTTNLVQALRQGEIELFESMFAEMSGFQLHGVRKALYETKGEGTAILCLSMGIPKQTFATIFLLSRKGRTDEGAIDPKELSRAMLIYDKVSVENAKLIADTWRMDPKYQDAIEAIETPATPPAKVSGGAR